jgi:threonine dehydrogenase-like Zn-dependent dehydrogenase
VVGPGEVLLKVAAAGICGSDIHGFLGHSERRKPGLVMGHEAVATVAQTAPGGAAVRAGERVSFNPLLSCGRCASCLDGRQNLCPDWRVYGMDRLHGTYAEYVSVPVGQLHPLPDALPTAEAILVEPVAVVLHAFRISFVDVPETLAIVGAGPLGCLALAVARLRGVRRACVIDRNPERLEAARRLGADLAVDPSRQDAAQATREWAGGRGAAAVVEAVGSAETRRVAVDAAAPGARIVFLGLAEHDSPLPWIRMIRDEQAVFTSFAYAPRDFQAAVRLVESRPFDLRPFTRSRPLEEGQQAFLEIAHAPGAVLKMMLEV